MTTLSGAVATATAAVPRVYEVGAVPKNPTYPYGVYSAQLLEDGGLMLDASEAVRWAQVVFQGFGKTAASAIDLTERFRTAVLGLMTSADGHSVGPFLSELRPTPPIRDPDDQGVLGVTTTLTATATKEP